MYTLLHHSLHFTLLRFNGVIDARASQDDVFKKVGTAAVQNAIDGFNSTIFAYGQTGIYLYIYTYIYICVCIYLHKYIHVYMVFIYMCIYIHTQLYVHFKCMCICITVMPYHIYIGSGKTFTLTGGPEKYSDRGIIPRAISMLFGEFRKKADTQFKMYISYMEIYNDKVRYHNYVCIYIHYICMTLKYRDTICWTRPTRPRPWKTFPR